MRGDPHPASVRLASTLPCTEHRRDIGPERGENMKRTKQGLTGRKVRLVRLDASGKILHGNCQPFTVAGRTYYGIKDAATRLHRSPHTIRAWIEQGLAVYVA